MVVKLNVLVAIIGAGLVVGLAGCSGAAAPQAAHSSSTPTPTNGQSAYLATVTALGIGGTDSDAIGLARTICKDIDANQPMSDLIASLVNSGAMDEADTRAVIRAAIVNYCPIHKDIAPAA